MKRYGAKFGVIRTVLAVFCLLLTSSFVQADVPPVDPYAAYGTVSYSGSQTERIYIQAQCVTLPNQPFLQNLGVSIAGPGGFMLRGLQPGIYYLRAFRDVSNTGIRHANDPVSTGYTISTADGLRVDIAANGTASYPGGNVFSISDPAPVAITPPDGLNALLAMDNTATLVTWTIQKSNGLIVPASYLIEWSATENGEIAGSTIIPASGEGRWLHKTTSSYWYRITAQLGGSSDQQNPVWVQAQPNPVQYFRTISGTITYSGYGADTGQQPLGTLYITATHADSNYKPYFVAVTAGAADSQTFSIPNLPDGSYRIQAFMDINAQPSGENKISAPNGLEDGGDLRMEAESRLTLTINGVDPPAMTLPLLVTNAALSATTSHSLYGEPGSTSSGESYGYILRIRPNLLTPINAQVTTGSRISVPADMGLWQENGAFMLDIGNLPTVATSDRYTVLLTYADASSESITLASTRPALQSPPTPTAPLFGVTYPAAGEPTFTWASPKDPAGASWQHNLQAYPLLSRSPLLEVLGLVTSYYSDPSHTDGWSLTSGNTFYSWSAVAQNPSGDTINYQSIFAAHPTAPVITGIWPASVLAGNEILIKGFNLASPTSVTVGGVSLAVTGSSATQITAMVPNPFTGTGTALVVTTANGSFPWGFYYGAPLGNGMLVSGTGSVKDAADALLEGVQVSLVGNPLLTSSTGGGTNLGRFDFNTLPDSSPFSLRISKTGYQPTYTAQLTLNSNFSAPSPYLLLTYTQLNSLANGMSPAMIPGKGAVLLKVKNTSEIPLAGATISVTSSSGTVYTPRYAVVPNNYTGTSGTTTEGNGMVLIPNVNHGDRLTITATKAAWAYSTMVAIGAAESLTYGEIYGWALPPTITSFSPAAQNENDGVYIYGTNFVDDASFEVKFNGLATPGRTVLSPTTIIANVPYGATTGPVSVITVGGTAISSTDFTVLKSLAVKFSSNGRGTITATSGATLSCLSTDTGDCGAYVPYGSSVTLEATPDYFSTFFGFLNDTELSFHGYNPYTFTMDQNQLMHVYFDLKKLLHNQESGMDHYTVDDAFRLAMSGQTLRALLGNMPDNGVIASLSGRVRLQGGYTALTDSAPSGYTNLSGPLNIRSGTLVPSRLKLK